MFETLLAGDGSRRRRLRKTLTLFLSLTVHAAAVAAIIVVPLLRAEARLPGFKVMDAALISAPIVPGVPPGPARSGKPAAGPAGIEKGPKNPTFAARPRGFLAPVEIPTEIVDENPAELLPADPGGPGVDGGTGDGTKPWIIGEEIIPGEVKPPATAMMTIRPPRLIKRVNPAYPPVALAARVAGAVVIAAVTDIYGRVRQARVVSGHALLSGAALEAVREWLYEPYLVNGIPRPVSFTVTVSFSLETR
ncbi:MAG: energy transducer TonB [Acidobacteria bacterium]|jgi:protein TonB|nr:energy transducer TonB [Acidobacteriota bacterium]